MTRLEAAAKAYREAEGLLREEERRVRAADETLHACRIHHRRATDRVTAAWAEIQAAASEST